MQWSPSNSLGCHFAILMRWAIHGERRKNIDLMWWLSGFSSARRFRLLSLSRQKLLKFKPKIGFTLHISISFHVSDTLPGSLSSEIETVISFSVPFCPFDLLCWIETRMRERERERVREGEKGKTIEIIKLFAVFSMCFDLQAHKTFLFQQPQIFR